jgi:hypothetical protein
MAAKKKRRKAGRPKGSKNKRKTKSSRKKTSSRKKSSKKKTTRKKSRSKRVPTAVIVLRAKALKRNKRAADVYRDVLGC